MNMERGRRKRVIPFVRNKLEITGRWKNKWTVKSFSKPDTEYTIGRDKKGEFYCDCPANVECKHIKLLRKMLEYEVKKVL